MKYAGPAAGSRYKRASIAAILLCCTLPLSACYFSTQAKVRGRIEEANYQYDTRRSDEALATAREAVELSRKAFGSGSAQTLESLSLLLRTLFVTEHFEEAEKLAYDMLEIHALSASTDWQGYADAFLYLGWIAEKKGELAAAESLLKKAYGPCETEVEGGPVCFSRAGALLRDFYERHGRYEDAEPFRIEHFEETENSPFLRRLLYYSSVLVITDFYREYGDYEKACSYYEKGLAEWKRRNAAGAAATEKVEFSNRRVSKQRENMGFLDWLSESATILQEAFFGPPVTMVFTMQDRRFFGIAPPGLEDYIEILQRMGRNEQARELQDLHRSQWAEAGAQEQRYLDELERIRKYSPSPLTVEDNVSAMAYFYMQRGESDKALPLYEEAHELRDSVNAELYESFKGSDTPGYIEILFTLAGIHFEAGRIERAEQLYLLSAERAERYLNDRHRLRLEALANLSLFYRRSGRDRKADDYASRYLELAKISRGEEHPDYIWGLAQLRGDEQAGNEPASGRHSGKLPPLSGSAGR